MSDINVAFCRTYLSQLRPDVERLGYKVNKDGYVYVYHSGWSDSGEFHGPGGFYHYCGQVSCAYEARYKGWEAFMRAGEKAAAAIATAVSGTLMEYDFDFVYALPA